MRREKPCTEPGFCRSCNRTILWVEWAATGRRMPVDSQDSEKGNVVLTWRRKENILIAETFDPELHVDRKRYVSHFATCPQSGQWRQPICKCGQRMTPCPDCQEFRCEAPGHAPHRCESDDSQEAGNGDEPTMGEDLHGPSGTPEKR